METRRKVKQIRYQLPWSKKSGVHERSSRRSGRFLYFDNHFTGQITIAMLSRIFHDRANVFHHFIQTTFAWPRRYLSSSEKPFGHFDHNTRFARFSLGSPCWRRWAIHCLLMMAGYCRCWRYEWVRMGVVHHLHVITWNVKMSVGMRRRDQSQCSTLIYTRMLSVRILIVLNLSIIGEIAVTRAYTSQKNTEKTHSTND